MNWYLAEIWKRYKRPFFIMQKDGKAIQTKDWMQIWIRASNAFPEGECAYFCVNDGAQYWSEDFEDYENIIFYGKILKAEIEKPPEWRPPSILPEDLI